MGEKKLAYISHGVTVKRRGKSSPLKRQRLRHGKPRLKQGQIGKFSPDEIGGKDVLLCIPPKAEWNFRVDCWIPLVITERDK